MRSELLADLLTIARGQSSPKAPATPVTPVTAPSGYRPKSLELQALQALQVKIIDLGKHAFGAETRPETDLPETIEERAALCAGIVPAPYLDTWAKLNHQKPLRVSDEEWFRAVDDGGRFLDAWGSLATEWGWTIADLFDVPRPGQRGGLFWFIEGATVEAFGPDHASLNDGRIFDRGTIGGEPC